MARKFSPAQERYIIARAVYEAAQEEFSQRMAPYNPQKRNLTNEEIQALVDIEMQIERETGLDKARSEYVKAEFALIDWMRSVIRKHPRYRQDKILLDQLFEKGMMLPNIREKLIDVAMRLSA